MSNQQKKTPRNFVVASYLVFSVFVLSIVHTLLPNVSIMAGMLAISIAVRCMMLGLAILLRLGYSWSKYLLALLALFTLLGIRDVLDVFMYPTVASFIDLVQVVLAVWATVLVFRKAGE